MAVDSLQTERVVGFECEFIELPPENLLQSECPVCLQIIREPHQVTCCGYSYCQACILRVKSERKPCPTCNAGKISNFPDARLKRSLYSLKVRCTHNKEGCEWTGELRQLDKHLNSKPPSESLLDGCQYAKVLCSYSCGNQIMRQYMQDHRQSQCPRRPFTCEYCHVYESTLDDVIHNHLSVCGFVIINCYACNFEVLRKDLESHLANICPLTIVSCDFHHVGCREKLQRQSMPDHLRENFLAHISLLGQSHAKQQVQIVHQQQEIARQGDFIMKQQDIITGQKTQIDSLAEENEGLRNSNFVLEKALESLEKDLERLKDKNGEIDNELAQQEHVVANQASSIQSFRDETKQLMAKLSLEVNRKCSFDTIPNSPVFVMNNFKHHAQTKEKYYSTSVYTHHQGYKIALEVDAGYVTGGCTYVSVFVYFLEGEFDNSLKWPFRGVISFQLLDQLDGYDHKADSITYDSSVEDKYCMIFNEESSWGLGSTKFIAHSELEPKYLKGNTLIFQIYNVQLHQ